MYSNFTFQTFGIITVNLTTVKYSQIIKCTVHWCKMGAENKTRQNFILKRLGTTLSGMRCFALYFSDGETEHRHSAEFLAFI